MMKGAMCKIILIGVGGKCLPGRVGSELALENRDVGKRHSRRDEGCKG